MKFYGYDATDEEESVEGFEEIEQGLNELFVQEVYPYVVEMYGEDDDVALNEAYNNWTDMLCKDGDISEYVYNNTCRWD